MIPPGRKKCGATARCPNMATKTGRGMCKKHYNIWRAVNRPVAGEVVREHIARLRSAGMGYARIAELGGVGMSTVFSISRGKRIFCRADIARAILALNPDVDRPARMDPIGAIRRVQSLVAMGYTEQQIGAAISVRQSNLWKYVQGTASWVRPETFDRIDAAYRTLGDQIPPTGWVAERARRRAAARGWLPPLAWRDGEIDDPDAQPDRSAVTVKALRAIGDSDFLAIVADHREHIGRSDAEIAAALGLTLDGFQSRLRRIDRRAS